MVSKTNDRHILGQVCCVSGLAITWLFFRSDLLVRLLCFGEQPANVPSFSMAYYLFAILLFLSGIFGLVFHSWVSARILSRISKILLGVGSFAVLLMIAGHALPHAAGVVAVSVGASLLAIHVAHSMFLWGTILSQMPARRSIVAVTAAVLTSSLISSVLHLPEAVTLAALFAAPILVSILAKGSEPDAGSTSPPDKRAATQVDTGLAVLVALFCIVGFTVRGISTPLGIVEVGVDIAYTNAATALAFAIALAVATKTDQGKYPLLVGLAFMLLFFLGLSLTILLSSVTGIKVGEVVTLVARAGITYALLILAINAAQTRGDDATLFVAAIAVVPQALALNARCLAFSFNFDTDVYASVIAPAACLTLILGMFVLLFKQAATKHVAHVAAPATAAPTLVEEVVADFNLTPKESEIAACLARGYALQKIADLQCVSINTVRTHCKSIYRKAGVGSKQELIDLVEKRSHP